MAETTTTLKGLIREKWSGTIDELAQAAGVAGSTAWNWWGGHARPQPGKRPALAKALSVTIDELEKVLGDVEKLRLPLIAREKLQQAAELLRSIGEDQPFTRQACADLGRELAWLLEESDA